MRKEYDFAKGERGKFYHPDIRLNIPIYLDEEVSDFIEKIAKKKDLKLIINDGPPGIGCPVIASLGGVDLGLVVTEPTLSGIHDMKRALTLLDHFKIFSLVCINKFDLNKENSSKIIHYCKSKGIEMVGTIPFDSKFTEAIIAGKPIIEYLPPSKVSNSIKNLWKKTCNYLSSTFPE